VSAARLTAITAPGEIGRRQDDEARRRVDIGVGARAQGVVVRAYGLLVGGIARGEAIRVRLRKGALG